MPKNGLRAFFLVGLMLALTACHHHAYRHAQGGDYHHVPPDALNAHRYQDWRAEYYRDRADEADRRARKERKKRREAEQRALEKQWEYEARQRARQEAHKQREAERKARQEQKDREARRERYLERKRREAERRARVDPPPRPEAAKRQPNVEHLPRRDPRNRQDCGQKRCRSFHRRM